MRFGLSPVISHILAVIRTSDESSYTVQELEDYLEELEHITFRFDDPSFAGGKTLNFAEGAHCLHCDD